jgi:hypothetical protein
MACFSTEAAFFAKPAIIGSYYVEQLKRDVPEDFIPPSMMCHPERLADTVKRMVEDRSLREELGIRAQKFVKERWNAKAVATRFLRIATGDIPGNWEFNPFDITYVYGYGLPVSRSANMVRAIIEAYGKTALQVTDKPALEQMFVEMAYADETITSI